MYQDSTTPRNTMHILEFQRQSLYFCKHHLVHTKDENNCTDKICTVRIHLDRNGPACFVETFARSFQTFAMNDLYENDDTKYLVVRFSKKKSYH